MKSEQLISFVFIAVLIFIIYEVILVFSPFVQAIFWAAILTFAFYPIYAKLKKVFPNHPSVSSLLMTILVFLIVLPPLIFLVFNLAAQIIEFSHWCYNYVKSGNLEQLISQARELPWLQKIQTHIVASDSIKNTLSTWLLNLSKSVGNLAAAHAGLVTKNFFFILLNLFFTAFLTFVFFKHGERIYKFFYDIAPFEQNTKSEVFKQIDDSLTAVIRGQLLTSLCQAAVAGIVFIILGVPLPLFFTFLTFLVSLVPIFGAASVWLPISIYFFMTHLYTKGIILFFVGLLGISLLDNLMKPAIIGEKTKLPYAILFFGIIGGMQLYGLMGIFLAPVVLSLFFALIKIYRKNYLS